MANLWILFVKVEFLAMVGESLDQFHCECLCYWHADMIGICLLSSVAIIGVCY